MKTLIERPQVEIGSNNFSEPSYVLRTFWIKTQVYRWGRSIKALFLNATLGKLF
jgi:hypothetical protein